MALPEGRFMSDVANTGRRNIALIGPFSSGKTTLLEGILSASGAVSRKGRVADGNTVGDGADEARAREMSVEVSAADASYQGVEFTFIDCPGSVEFAQETYNAVLGTDTAVIVCEPELERLLALSTLIRFLEQHDIPHLIFLNKIDHFTGRVTTVMKTLRPFSDKPLLLRQVPIRDGEHVTGYVDLITEQAYHYTEGGAAEPVDLPDAVHEREESARTDLLEQLANFNDELLEKLLDDDIPPAEEISADLKLGFSENRIVQVFLGSGEHDWGVRRLLDALVHETPSAADTAARRGLNTGGGVLAQVLKTYANQQGGKMSLARVWRGELSDGTTLNGARVAGIYRMFGQQPNKVGKASAGDIVGLGRLDDVVTGDTLAEGGAPPADALERVQPLAPVFALAVHTEKRDDEVKMSGAVAKLVEEDPSLSAEQMEDTHQYLLRGRGEMHLRVVLDRLANKFKLRLGTERPKVPYKEAIRKAVSQHARFKRQSGGHGQFGDVHLDVKPLPRGSGFEFHSTIVGGAVPRQYIPSVHAGVEEYLTKGPLGFPVVDVSVTLTDGQFHAVDSSDQAFRQAARLGMTEGMPKCGPVLLEPIYEVRMSVPQEFTPHTQRLVTGRRGHLLGFEAKDGWKGWDEIVCHMPQVEMHDLIIELRSLTQGTGSFTASYDHLQELTGRLANQVFEQAKAAED